jgi:fermentation-respiration switch protein FrsA (DUF1100 family)
MRLTTKKKLLLIFLSLLVGILFLPPISLRLKALATVMNLLIPAGEWRPLQIFTKTPSKELETIQSASGRTLDVHISTPARKTDAAMIIYTPFIGGGAEDLRLVNLAETFARAGFVVATPFRREEPLIVSTKDTEDIVSTALFLKNEVGLSIDRLGFFGISYGNGPAIAASVDPRVKNSAHFVVSFGGFYDLENALHFIRTGEFSYQDLSGKLEPHSYAKEILSRTIAQYHMTEAEFLKSEALANLIEKLSPSKVVKQITADLFVVHSTDDLYIPYTESMRLYDALRQRPKTTTLLALTTAFEHGTYKPPTFRNFREHYLPSFTSFYKLVYHLLATQ